MPVAGHVVDADARALVRHLKPAPLAVVSPSVWETDDTTADFISDFDRNSDGASFSTKLHNVSSCEIARRGVGRMHEQRAAVRASHQPRQVVHPRVVVSKLSSPDQEQLVCVTPVGLREETHACLAEKILGRGVNLSIDRRDEARDAPCLERAEVDTVWRFTEFAET